MRSRRRTAEITSAPAPTNTKMLPSMIVGIWERSISSACWPASISEPYTISALFCSLKSSAHNLLSQLPPMLYTAQFLL